MKSFGSFWPKYPILPRQDTPPPPKGVRVWRLIAVSPKDTISFHLVVFFLAKLADFQGNSFPRQQNKFRHCVASVFFVWTTNILKILKNYNNSGWKKKVHQSFSCFELHTVKWSWYQMTSPFANCTDTSLKLLHCSQTDRQHIGRS